MSRRQGVFLAAAALAAALSLLYAWWAWRSGPVTRLDGRPMARAGPEEVQPVDPRVLDHFLEAAFEPGAPPVLHKWTGAIRIGVSGSPSFDDRAEVKDLIRDLRPVLGGLGVELTEADENFEIRFLPLDDLGELEPDSVRKELGHVRTWVDERGAIVRSRVLIASGEEIPQYMRTHLIQDLGARALGLPGRPEGPWESALASQPNWMVQSLAPLDLEVVALLYRQGLRPGMTRDEVLAALGATAAGLIGTPGTPPGRDAGSS